MTEHRPEIALGSGFPAGGEAEWRALAEKVLKGADFDRRLVSRSFDGIGIGPLYTRKDGDGAAGEAPGVAPFTRGFTLAGAHPRWQVRQLHVETDPSALRAAIAEDLAQGTDAITVRFAAPGQSGLEPSADAVRAALAGLPLAPGCLYLDGGAAAALALDAVRAALGGSSVIGGAGLDPIGVLARSGEEGISSTPGGTSTTNPASWLDLPATTLVADGRPFHEAGGSEAQELAGLLGSLVSHLRAGEACGLEPAAMLPRIAIALAADADLFLTIAKLRAARRLAWRIADACGAGAAAASLRLSVSTSERMMTRRDPWVNMLRTTAAAAAAAMGGADAITVLPFTWALGRPDAFARRIARNTHHVLSEESGLGRVADPAGGAWSVERLTGELCAQAWGIFQRWEAEGGIVKALASGRIGADIAAVAEARATALATGRIALTGTTAFPLLGPDGVRPEAWPAAPVCRGGLLPPIRLAAPFEQLRDAADAASEPPQVFLVTLGSTAEHAARATWIQNLLAAGGIAGIAGEGFAMSQDAGRAFALSGAKLACICSTDEAYGQLGEAVAGLLKQAGALRVYVAGRPANADELRAAGVDALWYAGVDMLKVLGEVHAALGID